jgi:ribosome-binding factor A
MSKVRQERTAEQIQVILSELFLREVGDPRLAGVTITEVLIDRELMHANVYVNALGDDAREEEIMDGLQSASGFLRSQIAQRLPLRSAPFIHFHWDPRLRYVDEVNDLLDKLNIPDSSESSAAPVAGQASGPESE